MIRRASSNQELKLPSSKKVRQSYATIERTPQLKKINGVLPQDDKQTGLMQFYLSKEVQDIFSAHNRDLMRMFKDHSDFVLMPQKGSK